MGASRRETDAFGPIEVHAEQYWGAQTQRSLENFRIGEQTMPLEITALALIKKAAALVHESSGSSNSPGRGDRGRRRGGCGRRLDDEFPLVVWQTGSGTQTNMNVNEVIANRANEMLGGERGAQDAGASQRSRQSRPILQRHVSDRHAHRGGARSSARCCPALTQLRKALRRKAAAFADIVKIGRTHLQDATPLTLGQEFSGYAAQLEPASRASARRCPASTQLAHGGTAVGTGLNTHPGFAERVAAEIARDDRPAVRHGAEQVRGARRA